MRVEFRWANGTKEMVEVTHLAPECWVPVPRKAADGQGPQYRPAVFIRTRTEDGYSYEEVTLQ